MQLHCTVAMADITIKVYLMTNTIIVICTLVQVLLVGTVHLENLDLQSLVNS